MALLNITNLGDSRFYRPADDIQYIYLYLFIYILIYSAINLLILLNFLCFAHSVLATVEALDLSDHVVFTEPEITLQVGTVGLLPCRVDRTVYALYWKFGNDSATAEPLVILDLHFNNGLKGGKGYDDGNVDITYDYTLIIKDVTEQDEGRYICEVSDFLSGMLFRNHTDVQIGKNQLYTGWPRKHGTVDTVNFSGLCSQSVQQLYFTLLDKTSFPHYNNTKIIKFG